MPQNRDFKGKEKAHLAHKFGGFKSQAWELFMG
jgi:hypothetical protein